jgi:hypothetical protein
MSIETLSSENKAKLNRAINEGLRVSQEISDLKEGLRDVIKAVAEDLNIKPKAINTAIRAQIKNNLDEQRENMDDAEEILHLVGLRSA